MIDSTSSLPDGRTLAHTDIGAPDGRVALYFHGAPGSRFELAALDDAFRAADIRVITADRPGYGRSTPRRGRTTADWARDVSALADRLEIERFVVMGLSSGGPYAVACAALLTDRVTGAIIAAGNTDMSWPDARHGYLQSELDLMAADDEDAAVAWCEGQYGSDGSGFFGGDLDLGPTDNAWLADETNMTSLMRTMGEAFAQGVVGYAHDITVQGRPWTFDPAVITAPTIVVHGADDRLVPLSHSEHTAALIPGAELRVLSDCGHLSLVDHLPAIASEISEGGRSPR